MNSGTEISSRPVRLFPFKNSSFLHQPKTGGYERLLSSQILAEPCTRSFESTLPEMDPKGHLSTGDCAHRTANHRTGSRVRPVFEENKISFRRLRSKWEPDFLVRLHFSWGTLPMIHEGYTEVK